MAVIFGSISTVMANVNQKDSIFQEKMDLVQSTMVKIKLEEEIQNEVLDYLEKAQERPEVNQDIKKFFDLLSPFLKHKVMSFLRLGIIKQCEHFQNAADIEVQFFVQKLELVLYMPGDDIIKQGDSGENLFFIINGFADVILLREVALESLQ